MKYGKYAAVLLVAVLLAVWGFRENEANPETADEPDVPVDSGDRSSPQRSHAPRVEPDAVRSRAHRPNETRDEAESIAADQQVTTILVADADIDQKLVQLIALLDSKNPALREAALPHVAMLAGADKLMGAVPLLEDDSIAPEIHDELFASFFDQEPVDTAALLLEVVEHGRNPYVKEARETLMILLGHPDEENHALWKDMIREWREREMAE